MLKVYFLIVKEVTIKLIICERLNTRIHIGPFFISRIHIGLGKKINFKIITNQIIVTNNENI